MSGSGVVMVIRRPATDLASPLIGALKPDGTAAIITSLILLSLGWSFVNVSGSALFSKVVSDGTRASSQGGVDALFNLCGATAAFLAGPLLVLSSFSMLSILAMVVLVPLALLTIGWWACGQLVKDGDCDFACARGLNQHRVIC